VFSFISAGDRHTCAIEVGGQGYCWGLNADGELGTAVAGDKTAPTAIAGGRTFLAISAGHGFSCGVVTGGQAYCWGLNSDGQLGDGSKTARPQPQLVTGGLTFTTIATNTRFACGLVTGGAAYCWGINTEGQLGDGTNQPRVQPMAVVDGRTFNSIAAGEKHTCGTTPGGGGYCWGDNAEGALGNGATANSSRPVSLPNDRAVFTGITAGVGHTCATSTGGQGYCWGLNNLGQIGDNTLGTNRRSPVALDGGRTFINISAGNGHTCGVTNDNQVYCWGSNVNGQLGDGTTADKQIPFLVSFAGAAIASRR
jgi:hypothetical protein